MDTQFFEAVAAKIPLGDPVSSAVEPSQALRGEGRGGPLARQARIGLASGVKEPFAELINRLL